MFPLKDNIPRERLPLVSIALILANVIVYLLEIRHGGSFFGGPSDSVVVHYGAIPYQLTHLGKHCGLLTTQTLAGLSRTVACQGQPGASGVPPSALPAWMTAFTAMFLHANFLHIFGNMLFLGIFGPNVEEALGRPRFVCFYLLGGLVALAGQVAFDPSSTAPTIGASGAIAAVLGGYILLYPRARVLTLVLIVFFFTLVELPALVLLGLWFAEQLYFAAAGLTDPVGTGGTVAYFAHIGGFLFGLALVGLFTKRGGLSRLSIH
ncbi:MAG: rhomboid family intramembrane serine protease [Solirubrobacteraceae bacterium]